MAGTITVKVSADGAETSMEVNGVKGASCTDITKGLTDAIGMITDSEKTPEYYQEDLSVVNQGSR